MSCFFLSEDRRKVELIILAQRTMRYGASVAEAARIVGVSTETLAEWLRKVQQAEERQAKRPVIHAPEEVLA